MKIKALLFCLSGMIFLQVNAGNLQKPDSICTHHIVRGADGKILSWYMPEKDGTGYDHVIKLASEFLRDKLPVDPKTGLKLYYMISQINGMETGKDSYQQGGGAANNPAWVFAGFTESLAVKYRVYTGDESYLQLVKECLDHMVQHGSSPSGWKWEKLKDGGILRIKHMNGREVQIMNH